MWETVVHVSSGFTLVAFLAWAGVLAYQARLRHWEAIIKSASEKDRAPLILKTLAFFDVKTREFSEERQFHLALEQIKNREKRYRTSAFVVLFVVVVAATVTVVALIMDKVPAGQAPREASPPPLAQQASATPSPSAPPSPTPDTNPSGPVQASPTPRAEVSAVPSPSGVPAAVAVRTPSNTRSGRPADGRHGNVRPSPSARAVKSPTPDPMNGPPSWADPRILNSTPSWRR